jgi:hypothetical protein
VYTITYIIVSAFFHKIEVKIFIFISICFPFFLVSIIGVERENIFVIIKYFIKYLKSKKIYLYK